MEGIIALMHEMLGDIFDVKQFLDAQPKILNEFKKRIDPDLEFFTGQKQMNAIGTLNFLHLMNHQKALLRDLIELHCQGVETLVSLCSTELP